MKTENVIKSNAPGFSIRCKNTMCIGGRIETTLSDDSGYSNWTVMDDGAIEFKCHGCGKFASTDTLKNPNEMDNFELLCLMCDSYNRKDGNWKYKIGDVDGYTERTHIECKTCSQKVY